MFIHIIVKKQNKGSCCDIACEKISWQFSSREPDLGCIGFKWDREVINWQNRNAKWIVDPKALLL
jgi:hypothetical protein